MNATRKQVQGAVQALLLFTNLAVKNTTLSEDFAHKLREQAVGLLEQVASGKVETRQAVTILNRLITQMNRLFPKDQQWASYPLFVTDHPVLQLKGEVLALEHYLNQQLQCKGLSLQVESPIFKKALVLWRDVGLTLTPKEGVGQLSQLIQELNKKLTSNEQYPLPDEKSYDA